MQGTFTPWILGVEEHVVGVITDWMEGKPIPEVVGD